MGADCNNSGKTKTIIGIIIIDSITTFTDVAIVNVSLFCHYCLE